MDRMDIYDIKFGTPKSDILRKMLKGGQTVTFTRIVTIDYNVDISDILEEMDETEISVEDLIQHEMDNNGISCDLEYSDETDKVDDMIISVKIA